MYVVEEIFFLGLFLILLLGLCVYGLKIFFIDPYNKSLYAHEKKYSWSKVLFNKGILGEYRVAQVLEGIPGCRKLLYNVYVPLGKTYQDKEGNTHKAFTEIDLLMIHERGMVVVEAKRYKGWIFGNDHQNTWTVTYKGGNKRKFHSPLVQNDRHIEALRAWMQSKYHKQYDISALPFYNLVVFSGECELKKINVTKEGQYVTRIEKLPQIYSKIMNNQQTNKIFTPQEVVTLYREIGVLTQVTPQEKRAHKERVRQIQADIETATAFN